MKASSVKISELIDYQDCIDAIDSIEMDHRNVIGGQKAFMSGERTFLTKYAEKKLKQ